MTEGTSEFKRWARAVEAACAEAGVDMMLYPGEFYGDNIWGYSWSMDHTYGHEGWEIVHKALVLCDKLRPEWVMPSAKLLEKLLERN